MKKLLLLFTLLFTAFGYASAQEELLYRCQFGEDYNSKGVSSYTTSFTVTDAMSEGFSWEVQNANNNNNGWNFIKFGSKNAASVGYVTTAAAVPEVITGAKINLTAITSGSVNSVKFQISEDADFTDPVSYELNKSVGEQFVTIDSESDETGKFFRLVVDCAKGSNGVVTLEYIELFGYDPNDPRAIVDLSWSDEDLVVMRGEVFEQPVLTAYNGETLDLDALQEVEYSTSNSEVAIVADGTIKIIGDGQAVITATIPETSKNFRRATASINVIVVKHFTEATITGVLTAGEGCFNATGSYGGVKYISDLTGIIYQGNMVKGTGNNAGAIQIKAENPIGIVVSANKLGLVLRKVTVEWSTKASDRSLQVYAADAPYSSSADLYDEAKCGTEIGSLNAETTVLSLDPKSRYTYVGFKAVGGVIYINSITLEWEKPYSAKGFVTVTPVENPETGYLINNLGLTVTVYDELGQPIENQDDYIVYMNGEEIDFAGDNIEFLPYDVNTVFTVQDNDSELPVEVIGWSSIAGATTTIDNLKYNIVATSDTEGELWATFELGISHALEAQEVYSDFVFKGEDGSYEFETEHMAGKANIYWSENGKAMCQLQGVKIVEHDGNTIKNEEDLGFDNITITPVLSFLVENRGQQSGRMRAPSANSRSVHTVEGMPTSLNHNNVLSPENITLDDVSGVADVVVDGEAVVEFYNLQGVKVNGELAPGLYIRRQGNVATKVVVK